MSEIKPCPFCGEKPMPTYANKNRFCCPTNHCPNAYYSFTKEQWNTRPVEDALRSERDEWRKDAEKLAKLVESTRHAYDLMGLNGVDRITQEGFDNFEQALITHHALVDKESKQNDKIDKN